MFFFAERRAEEERMLALVSVSGSGMVATALEDPLEGDILKSTGVYFANDVEELTMNYILVSNPKSVVSVLTV